MNENVVTQKLRDFTVQIRQADSENIVGTGMGLSGGPHPRPLSYKERGDSGESPTIRRARRVAQFLAERSECKPSTVEALRSVHFVGVETKSEAIPALPGTIPRGHAGKAGQRQVQVPRVSYKHWIAMLPRFDCVALSVERWA